MPSYGYPEVREYVLSQVKELIGYKPDGIYFDVSRTHSGIYPVLAYGWYPQWTSPYLKYGYELEEAGAYKKLYGNPPLCGIISLRSLKMWTMTKTGTPFACISSPSSFGSLQTYL